MKSLMIFALLSLPIWVSAAPLVSGETITHDWYTLSYNERHEVANWVSYTLESSQLRNCVSRASSFRADPLVSTGSADPSDYKNSGYDRGHLLPAGDMKFDSGAMKDTFYLSNVTPQPASFNRGKWSQLETLIRAWARKYGKIWIVTGPVLRNGLPSIGNTNRVSVPEEFYKVILRKDRSGTKGIAFLMPVNTPYPDMESYGLAIDSVEQLTHNDFFPFLKADEERRAEGNFDLNDWDFSARFDYLPCGA